jgi:hypothetical protein
MSPQLMDDSATNPLHLSAQPPLGPLYGRLSIAHLLLITAGSAVAIWLMQPPNGKADAVAVAISVFFAPVYGTALAVTMMAFLRARSQWVAIAEEPGHWLFIIIGGGFAGPALMMRSGSWINQSPAAKPQHAEALLAFGGICVAVALTLMAVVSLLVVLAEYRDSRRWHTVFGLLAATLITPTCCGPVGILVFPPALLGLLGATAYAAVTDFKERQYRDLWHWLGIAALFAAVCHAVLFLILVLPRL